jgi:hypothetical protein
MGNFCVGVAALLHAASTAGRGKISDMSFTWFADKPLRTREKIAQKIAQEVPQKLPKKYIVSRCSVVWINSPPSSH